MLRYFIQRFFFMIVTLLLVSVIIFIIIELPPGDYADRYAYRKLASAGQAVTEEDMRTIRHQFGLDKPPVLRYFRWIGDIVLHGDFGVVDDGYCVDRHCVDLCPGHSHRYLFGAVSPFLR